MRREDGCVRRLLGTVLVLVVIAVVLVVGDQVARSTAEQRIATAVSQAVTVTGSQHVTVAERTPFLLQLVRGSVQTVDVRLDGAQLQGLTATDVHVSATDVAVAAPHRAAHVTADGVLPPATVQQVLAQRTGMDVTMSVDGSAMKATGKVLGLDLSVDLAPRVDGGRLLVDATAVTLGGRAIPTNSLPAALRQGLTGLQVPLNGLPKGMTLTSANVVPAGVHVTLAGDDVVAPSSGATSTP